MVPSREFWILRQQSTIPIGGASCRRWAKSHKKQEEHFQKPIGLPYPKDFKLKLEGEGDKLFEANFKHKSQVNQSNGKKKGNLKSKQEMQEANTGSIKKDSDTYKLMLKIYETDRVNLKS